MVRQVFKMMYREVRGLHQAAYVLAFFTLGSQFLALVRDRILAHQFGAGYELDLYYAAFKLPDLLYVLFASTLSVYVLIPFVAGRKRTDGDQAAASLLSQVFTLFLIAYAALAAVLIGLAPYIVPHLFPGLESEILVTMVRILLLQPLLLGISSLLGVVTQLSHRFVLFAISPLIYNFGIIFGVTALYPLFGLYGLAYGVVLGALGHMLIQVPLIRQSELSFSLTKHMEWRRLKEVLVVSLPRAFTLSVTQLVLLAFVSFASVMTVGSVAVFQFAFNLQSVPLAIIGVSYSVAAFPLLAEQWATRQYDAFRFHITTALRHVIFWALPAIALVVVLRAQLVRVILGTGAFNWEDTRLTAALLGLLCLSLVAQAANLLMIRAFYAGGETKLPLYTSLLSATIAIGSALGLMHLFATMPLVPRYLADVMRVQDVFGTEVLLLGVSYSVALIIQSLVLLWFLRRRFTFSLRWLPRHVLHATGAAVLGGTAAYATLNFIVVGINPDTFVGIFLQGAAGGVMGIFGTILAYSAFSTPELREVAQAFHRKLFRTDVVKPQENIM